MTTPTPQAIELFLAVPTNSGCCIWLSADYFNLEVGIPGSRTFAREFVPLPCPVLSKPSSAVGAHILLDVKVDGRVVSLEYFLSPWATKCSVT